MACVFEEKQYKTKANVTENNLLGSCEYMVQLTLGGREVVIRVKRDDQGFPVADTINCVSIP